MTAKADASARPTKKKLQSEASIEAILDATKYLFVTQGFYSTRIDDIAKRAGLTKGAVYFHFKDKEALLKALLDRVRDTILEPLVAKVEEGGGHTPTDRLVAFLHHEASLASRDPAMLLLPIVVSIEFNGRGNEIEKYVRAGYRRIERMLEKALQEGVAAGEFRDDISPHEQATILLALNDGMMLAWLRRSHELDGVALMRAMRSTLWHGICAPAYLKQSTERNAVAPSVSLAKIFR